jgi:hypothetical protein
MRVCEECGRNVAIEAHARGCPNGRTYVQAGRRVRASVPRVAVAEGELKRNWQPEQYTNEEVVWYVLGLLVECPRSQAELFDLLSLQPGLAEYAAGTIRAHVSAALLWLRRDGLAEPTGTRDERSFVWRATN